MAVHCSVFGCTNNNYTLKGKISIHTFPKDPDVRSTWIRATRRQNWIPTKSSVVCSDHFHKNDFKIMKPGKKNPMLKPGAIPSHMKRQETPLLSSQVLSKQKNKPISNTKSDSLTRTAGPLLKNGGNQEGMKLQCLECRAAFDLEYDTSKKLHTLKPDSILCSHVKQGGKTAAVSIARSEPTPGKPASEVLTQPLKSDHEPSKSEEMPFQCLRCPASFGLEHDLKQHQAFVHEENVPKRVSSVKSVDNSKAKPLLENVQRVFDMNSLPSVCFFESPEINGDHDTLVNHSKVHLHESDRKFSPTEFPHPIVREVSSCFVLEVPLPCLDSS